MAPPSYATTPKIVQVQNLGFLAGGSYPAKRRRLNTILSSPVRDGACPQSGDRRRDPPSPPPRGFSPSAWTCPLRRASSAVFSHHRTVGERFVAHNIRTPHLLRAVDRQPPQQVRVVAVTRLGNPRTWLRLDLTWLRLDRFQGPSGESADGPDTARPTHPRAAGGAPSVGWRRTGTQATRRRSAASTPNSPRSPPPVACSTPTND